MSMQLSNPFINSVKTMMMGMANIDVAVTGTVVTGNDEIISYGLTSMVACVGKIKGRLLLDMEHSLAVAIAQNITGVYYSSVREYMVLAAISELSNIIAGDATTAINNQYSLDLRLATPIILTGRDVVISIPKISTTSLDCTTRYGKLKLNVAFERGE